MYGYTARVEIVPENLQLMSWLDSAGRDLHETGDAALPDTRRTGSLTSRHAGRNRTRDGFMIKLPLRRYDPKSEKIRVRGKVAALVCIKGALAPPKAELEHGQVGRAVTGRRPRPARPQDDCMPFTTASTRRFGARQAISAERGCPLPCARQSASVTLSCVSPRPSVCTMFGEMPCETR